ncbi:hypothetical protein QYM36_010788 [Artemia franciscana]|uniref:Reverse transcriptase domain-containing protein n=1 Tax=Artemia franciscana TaxID=6661 RepID=A0AA88HR13_ARTSF|nr:hypothetical protein QYM36_010788 [Artemia franciscana]
MILIIRQMRKKKLYTPDVSKRANYESFFLILRKRNNIEEQLGVVRIENGLTDFFYLKSGLRQGCVLSPTLFTIIIDFVSRHCRFRGGIELCPRQSLQDGNFVDDVALISRFQEEASISSQEVKDTISKLQPGATGPDGIHNLMLKNLPDSFVELLTELFNRSVIESAIPSGWNKAIVIPLLKAGKDPKLVDSYRPISLTSCVAKLIERVIKQRILTPLSDHIQIEQLGFLPGRSTTDALVRLEHLIKLSFKKGKAVHVIFLDMDSAFDRVDVGQLIRKLSVMGLPDLLVNWIHPVLMGREVQASLGGSYSEFKRKAYNIGLPQGSVLSPLIFSVYCHDISLENVLEAELFLYADDIGVAVVGRGPLCLQSASQKTVDTLSIRANSNNMVFSTHKSVSVLFHKIHNLAAFKPQVKLNGQGIVVAEHARFLGVIFDHKMTWKPHLDELIGSLKQRQNFINALCLGRRGAPTVFASTIVKPVQESLNHCVEVTVNEGIPAYVTIMESHRQQR